MYPQPRLNHHCINCDHVNEYIKSTAGFHSTCILTFVRTWGWIWFRTRYRRKASSRWQWWFDSYHPVSPAGYGSSCCLGRGCKPTVVYTKIYTQTINKLSDCSGPRKKTSNHQFSVNSMTEFLLGWVFSKDNVLYVWVTCKQNVFVQSSLDN